jgi:spectinomycin phosphotransferase
MLEKPAIRDEDIVECVQTAYRATVIDITFLPLGADINTAIYRANTDDGAVYFVKLRHGSFDEISVALPKWLSEQGIAQIIAPLATDTGQLWASRGNFTVVLYPFVAGHDGYVRRLSARQWYDFGAALKRLHRMKLPSTLVRRLQREHFSSQSRERVLTFLSQYTEKALDDPVAVKLAAFLQLNRDIIVDLVERAGRFSQALATHPPAFVLCHADVHPGNILIDGNDRVYVVDWDAPLLAPKERDLMFIGGGQGFVGYTAQEEERLFYQGYGQTSINAIGLTYYRYERIIEDIAGFCEQIFLSTEAFEDRQQSLRYVISNFLPGNTIEQAYAADPTLNHS